MRTTKFFSRLLTAALPLALLLGIASAQTLHTTRVGVGLSRPTGLYAPAGDLHRLFVTEQWTGNVRIIKDGVLLPTSFITVSGVVSGVSEQGLLGMAFHPNYAANGKFYLYYNTTGGGMINIREYTVSANPDVANAASTATVLQIAHADWSNHNGGCMQFGPDGLLYVGVGDGGNGCDTGAGHNAATGNGQSLSTYLGKILRIDVDNAPSYVAAGNPFAAGSFPHIWDIGIRNPWRFSFDRGTGDLYIADVGQNQIEEIDFEAAGGPGGVNYGWRCFEGNSCSSVSGCSTTPCACNTAGLTFPIQTYTHGSGCSITGGFVYRGNNIPGLQGTYFYADYCTSTIWSFRYSPGGGLTNFTVRTAELDPPGSASITSIVSFGEDGRGELYIVEQGGEVWRIDGPVPGMPDCPGDDTSIVQITCPCGNTGALGHGCGNSINVQGALLSAEGSVNPDTLRLTCSGMPATTTCVFLKGDALNVGGTTFGDGVLCVTGTLIRLRTKMAQAGFAYFPEVGDPMLSVRGQTPPGSGLTGYYRTYYRNAAVFCQPETFNVSNGYEITW